METLQLNEKKEYSHSAISKVLLGMKVGDEFSWPLGQTPSVRVLASQMGLCHGRVYKTSTNKTTRLITARRVE